AAMDIRVIDTATGRIVASTAVEGRNSSYGIGLDGLLTSRTGYIALPGVLDFFSNTPVQQALQKMVTAAIGKIT
ncbi:CsgG/HfaB family protein, partial [Vibrio parahaemolyticus]